MIVRISTEGQYQMDSDLLDKINDLDNQLVEVVAAGDKKAFESAFKQMLDLVRKGKPVDSGDICVSDVILPPPDLSIEEAKELFVGEGLVPG